MKKNNGSSGEEKVLGCPQLAEILESGDHVIYRIDFESGRFDYVSAAAAALFGMDRESVMAAGLAVLARHLETGELERRLDHFRTLCAVRPGEPKRTRIDYSLTTASGETRRFSDCVTLLSDSAGRLTAACGIATDVSGQWRAEESLRETEERFRATMEAAQVGVFVLQDSAFRYVNPYLARLFGFGAHELLAGMGPLDLVAPEARATVADEMRRPAPGDGKPACEVLARRRDGSVFPAMVMASPASYGGRPATVGTLVDLTALRMAESRIQELAYFDPLTALPNRRLLQDRLAQALAKAEREHEGVAVLCLDLDHFKRINDSLGHGVGDALLCAVAERLGEVVRRVDTLARQGGDEFILVLPGAPAAAAAEVARRLAELCALPFRVAGHELTVTPSIGISVFPEDGRDADTLLRNADTAMYQAKEAGRNAFQFYSARMNEATLELLLMESSLRSALGKGEFVLHYQPVVALASGRIVAVEALVRWHHPRDGTIGPDRFVPVAEDTGLINPIGDWVLCEACRQARRWQEDGIAPLTVAVNVSPLQFRQAGFVQMVAGALAASGLDAGLLELELTERTVMHDAEANLDTLAALHRMGVALAVDDFGTGYSSLSYLKRFPVGKLKIDQSFVQDIVDNADDLAIAAAITSLGRSLRLKVVAEGVETAAQLDLLRRQGCELAQGYHFARALPADECADLLRRQPFLLSGESWKL